MATLLFSLPTQSRVLTAANVLINTLVFAAVIDFAASPFFDTAQDVTFTRVGAVYPDSVKVVTRYPDHSTLRVLYREVATEPWKDGPDLHLSPDSDWAATARIENLWPSTPYECMRKIFPLIACSYSVDVLATANHTVLPVPTAPIPFRTAPDSRLATARRFRFVASSCTVPNFPYRGPHHRRSIHGFDRLADYLALNDTVSTDFMLFLGDFIYADVPFYVGDDVEAYRRLYRRNYQSPSFRRVYERLRASFLKISLLVSHRVLTAVLHAYDDHEVRACRAPTPHLLTRTHSSLTTTQATLSTRHRLETARRRTTSMQATRTPTHLPPARATTPSPTGRPRSSSSTRGVTVRGPRLMGTARCSERNSSRRWRNGCTR